MGTRIKRNLIAVFVGVFLYAMYFVMMVYFDLSFWLLLAAYAFVLGIAYFINRKSIWGLRGNFLYASGQRARAKKYLQKAVDADVKSPASYVYLALILVQDDKNATDAFTHLDKALKYARNPQDERYAITTMATCHYMAGDAKAAIKVLEDMRQKHEYTNANSLVMLGYLYFVTEEYDKAIEVSKLALEEEMSNGAAWDNIGQVHFKQENYEEAREAFEKALGLQKTLADSNYFMGIICEMEDELDEAREYFRMAAISPILFFNTITQEMADEKFDKYHN